ncbi:major capsid protein [Vibrio owensii]|uniref:major capsid protein n=1 Tax=Vibrio owensii TaxID=696485 RepID=UPI003394D329
MPLLKEIAENISNNQLIAGVIEEIITEESLYWMLPFVQVNGKAYVYNREVRLADSEFLGINQEVPEDDSEFKSVTTHLKILIGDVDVDKFVDTTMSDTNNQKAIQLAMKAKGMGRRFKDALINGKTKRTNPNTGADIAADLKEEFEGVRKIWKSGLADASYTHPGEDPNGVPDKDGDDPTFNGWQKHWVTQVIHMDGSSPLTGNAPVEDDALSAEAITFEKLDELLDAIPGDADFLMMRKDTYRAYKALLRTTGATTPEMMMIRNFGQVPQHDGTPIIINDYLPTLTDADGNKYTEIYALRTNEVDGLHGLYGGSNAGIVVEDIGTVQNKDATRTRLKWYAGLALKSTKSMAVLRGVLTKKVATP